MKAYAVHPRSMEAARAMLAERNEDALLLPDYLCPPDELHPAGDSKQWPLWTPPRPKLGAGTVGYARRRR